MEGDYIFGEEGGLFPPEQEESEKESLWLELPLSSLQHPTVSVFFLYSLTQNPLLVTLVILGRVSFHESHEWWWGL